MVGGGKIINVGRFLKTISKTSLKQFHFTSSVVFE